MRVLDVRLFDTLHIAERITGEGFEKLAGKWIFEPLGMKKTTYFESAVPEDKKVFPWFEDTKSFVTDISMPVVTGDAGIWSTAGDFIGIPEMLLGHGEYNGRRILNEATVEFIMRKKVQNSRTRRGFGSGEIRTRSGASESLPRPVPSVIPE